MRDLFNKCAAKVAVGFALMAGFAGSAQAAISPLVAPALAGLEADALAMIDLVWPFVLAVFGGLLLMTLFKRAGRKI